MGSLPKSMRHEADLEGEYPTLVEFDGPDDPDFPQNWKLTLKVWVTFVITILNLIGTIGTSIFGTGKEEFMHAFNISREVAVLGTTLFLVGYIFGFLLFGPLSERFGRKWPLLVGVAMSSIFDLMPALGKDIATVLIGRFLGGLFGVAPIAVFGGVVSDCWPLVHRGIAMALVVSLVFSGPTFGPIFGGFIMGSPSLNWRWTMWVLVIIGLSVSALCVFVYPETYPPAILRAKARSLRKKTGNRDIRTASDKEGTGLKELTSTYLVRPFCTLYNALFQNNDSSRSDEKTANQYGSTLGLITTQPILAFLTLYQSFVFGVLFLFYQVYPFSFGHTRGWSVTLEYLPLLAIICGILAGAGGIVIYNQVYFRYHCHAQDGSFIPESRLPPMIVGSLMIPIGMFWFAWTAAPEIPWPSSVCASFLIGCGMYLLFIQGFTYIVDCYTVMANSAMGVNGSMRSVFGAVFPLFADQMVQSLGVAYTATILGAVSVALIPVPICFWYWGSRIRAWSSAKLPSNV